MIMAEKTSGGSRLGRESSPEWRRRAAAALRSTVRLQLLEAIRTCPGVDARRLAQAIGSSPPRLYYHIKILVDAGLIREANHGSRSSSRGPAATRYECCDGVLPAVVLGPAGVRAEHFSRVRTQVFDEKGPEATPDASCFTREALRPDEIEKIRRLVGEIGEILKIARDRRRASGSLSAATAFVGVCLAKLKSETLPDNPLESDRA